MFAASFQVRLTLVGPIISHSSSIGGYGIDAVMARTRDAAGIDRFYLAGTLVKGLLGEAWQELGHHGWRDSYLGEISDNQNLPNRGCIFLTDFIDRATPTGGLRTLYRNQIDSFTGSVTRGMFQILEAPWKSGEDVHFEGTVRLIAESQEKAAEMRSAIERGLHWITAAGGDRTAGFGRVKEIWCGPLESIQVKLPSVASSPEWLLDLTFDQPFCLAVRPVADNIFESDTVIPGGAIKGILAEAITGPGFEELKGNLHAVRFAHAFPASSTGARPERVPLSVVRYKHDEEKCFYNVVLSQNEALSNGEEPMFQIDWKNDPVTEHCGWPSLDTELRVRTKIDDVTRRAEDANLFAYRMIVPHGYKVGDTVENRVWRSRISLDKVPEGARPIVAEQLRILLGAGLCGLGKTKAWARPTIQAAKPLPYRERPDRLFIVTLQTPALLCDPRDLAPDENAAGFATVEAMHAAYEKAWNDLSGGVLELSHYFHQNSLAGGGYMRHRFQYKEQYRPYLLTDPGSVFVFQVKDESTARQLAEVWLRDGLPIRGAIRDFYHLAGLDPSRWWQRCPYLPENGFAEVAINSEIHDTEKHQLQREEQAHAHA